MLSCRLTFGPLWFRIFLFLWWFLLAFFGLFVLHWRYELPCQDKLPEFHYTPIVGCIRVFWLVLHPLGLELDKGLFGWNSVTPKQEKIKFASGLINLSSRGKSLGSYFSRSSFGKVILIPTPLQT